MTIKLSDLPSCVRGELRKEISNDTNVQVRDFSWGEALNEKLKKQLDSGNIAIIVKGVAELVRVCVLYPLVHKGCGVNESIRVLEVGDVLGLFEWSKASGPECFKNDMNDTKDDIDPWRITAGLTTVSTTELLDPLTYLQKASTFKSVCEFDTYSEFPLDKLKIKPGAKKTQIALVPTLYFNHDWLVGTFFKQYSLFALSSMRFRQNYRYANLPDKKLIAKLPCGKYSKSDIVPIFLDIIFRTLHSKSYIETAYREVKFDSLKSVADDSAIPKILISEEWSAHWTERKITGLMIPIKIRDYAGGPIIKDTKELYLPFSVRSPFAADACHFMDYVVILDDDSAKNLVGKKPSFKDDLYWGLKTMFDGASKELIDVDKTGRNKRVIDIFLNRKEGTWLPSENVQHIKRGWIPFDALNKLTK
jgi:hypothetical protein